MTWNWTKYLIDMEELYRIFLNQTEVLEKFGFYKIFVNLPEGSSFGANWRHPDLGVFFNIHWDRQEMLIVSFAFGSINEFNWFYKILDEYCINYNKNKLIYSIHHGDQYDKLKFSETLEYNLNKLKELLMVIS